MHHGYPNRFYLLLILNAIMAAHPHDINRYRLLKRGQWPDFDPRAVLERWWLQGSDLRDSIDCDGDEDDVLFETGGGCPPAGGAPLSKETRLYNAQQFMKYYIPGAVVKRLIDGQVRCSKDFVFLLRYLWHC